MKNLIILVLILKNSEIKLFNQLDNLIEKAQYLVFLGQNEGRSFFAVDLVILNKLKKIKILWEIEIY